MHGKRLCVVCRPGAAAMINARDDEEATKVFLANLGIREDPGDVKIAWPADDWYPNQKLLGAMIVYE